MKHRYLHNLPLEEAAEKYRAALAKTARRDKTQTVESRRAAGRVCAQAVYALRCLPHYNACAMDGIALKAEKTFGAGELTPVTLAPADFVEVDTGDPLPDGCDCVVMAEDVVEGEGGAAVLHEAAVPWQHVRQTGEDISRGDMLMPSYTLITPALAGALVAAGHTKVRVLRKPLAGIIPTGDEIVPASREPDAGEITEFNSVILEGMLAQWGARAKTYPIFKDRRDLLEQAVAAACRECDVVLVIAGSSAGREDYTAAVIAALGEVFVHGIAIKPGKPAVLGAVNGKPCVGVPGYSVSAMMIMEKIVRGVVADLLHQPLPKEKTTAAVLTQKLTSSLKYREFVRASLSYAGGRLSATPLHRGAGVITSFTKARGIIDIPQNLEGCERGETVPVTPLDGKEDFEHVFAVVGSHDPLIDEIADILKRGGSPVDVSSSHTGSMGAVAALKSGGAHTGGIHLLDAATGEYNLPWLKRYFPEGGVALIEGVRRQQGLLVRRGNPLGLKGFESVAGEGVRYVNRQKGSGTRVLFDYLAGLCGIDTAAVDGYTREEYTHTAVAANIAQGSADTGLGILAAAKIYALDFIPVAAEEYDFICPAAMLGDEKMQAFLAALASDELARRLAKLGGYELKNPGTVKAVL